MGGVASSLKNIPFCVSLYLLINLCGLFNYSYWPLWPFPGIVVWLVRTMGVMERWFSSQYLETHRIATLWWNSSWLENFQCVKVMLGLAFEHSSQINKSMGLNGGQILKKVSLVKETKYLSKGGRLIWIKSTWSNILIYLISLFTILRMVSSRHNKFRRNFL